MKLEDVKTVARRHGIPVTKARKADLVRAIQNAEGNSPCYQTGASAACGQCGCLWREDCA